MKSFVIKMSYVSMGKPAFGWLQKEGLMFGSKETARIFKDESKAAVLAKKLGKNMIVEPSTNLL